MIEYPPDMTVDELIALLEPHRGKPVRIFSHAGLVPQGWWQENPINSVEVPDEDPNIVRVVASS